MDIFVLVVGGSVDVTGRWCETVVAFRFFCFFAVFHLVFKGRFALPLSLTDGQRVAHPTWLWRLLRGLRMTTDLRKRGHGTGFGRSTRV